jgi:hypothetical protein
MHGGEERAMERSHPAVHQCPFRLLALASLSAIGVFGLAYALLA